MMMWHRSRTRLFSSISLSPTMLHWNEYSAWVTIDGEDAVEYDVQTSEDDKTVTCWIASELGKKFSISWKDSSSTSSVDVMGYLTVDGIYCGGSVLFGTAVPETMREDGIYDGNVLQPFMFSSVKLTDDDAFLGSSHEKLGLIELQIGPVEVTDEDSNLKVPSISNLTVHERAKKGVTQQITLAEPEILEEDDEDGFDPVDTLPCGPDIVKFCFKYRSIDVLRANGIVPRLKRKASTERPNAQDSNDLIEEAKILRERLRAVEAQLLEQEQKPRVKNELDGAVIDLTQDSSWRSKRVKLERKPFTSGEVIDLT
ncbi:hypothetical protein MVEN_00827800 [Mycena venus]|uniref:DUF7918 domain-containing protein n=1 Tax=Mycena venus TaxID=2733690 RepID=A0A8H6YDP7_9AGAR|nr:hypothetical protein MVEN_00827800 [Mycena venus]